MAKYPIAFGRHLLLERINVGGMAEVFKAKAMGVEGFERIVAVKRILPTLAEDDEFTTMFVDEARIVAHLTHQNVVQIYELGKHDGTLFISMEYVAGRDLRQLLDHQKKTGQPMEIGKSCYIISKVAEALDYAHRKRDPAGRPLKIIHRDVTPQNVIISFEGETKLCDFGIAKAASRASRTQVGVLKGKFAYMSPEQVRGQPTDRRGDLFALGVLFYEMLTGERLFLGDSDYATLEAVRAAMVPSPRSFNPKITPELEAIAMKLLARDPKDRYQWAGDVQEDLLDHAMAEGRPYHLRHLRRWMQSTWAREIEIENAKLERFMRLTLRPDNATEDIEKPRAAEVVQRMAAASEDEPEESGEFDQHDDQTIEGVAALRFDSNLEAHPPIEEEDFEDRTVANEELGSPVSDLFGTPALAEDPAERAPNSDPMVRPADSVDSADYPRIPADDGVERTQFDAVDPALAQNQTLFDEDEDSFDETNATLMNDGVAPSISEAQAELLDRLDRAGALDEDNTIDSSDLVSDEPTLDGLHSEIEGYDATNVAPLVVTEETSEAAYAPTALRPEATLGFDEMDDDGTLEQLPDDDVLEVGIGGSTRPSSVSVVPGRMPAVRERSELQPVPLGRRATSAPPSPPTPSAVAKGGAVSMQSMLQSQPKVVMALAGGLALLSILLIVALISFALGSDEASLHVITSPPVDGVLMIDEEIAAEEPPFEVHGLSLGAHKIEVRADGFVPYRQTIQIQAAKPHSMNVPLEPLPRGASNPTAPDVAPARGALDAPEGRTVEGAADRAADRGEAAPTNKGVALAREPAASDSDSNTKRAAAPPPDELAAPPPRAPPAVGLPPKSAPPPPRARAKPKGGLVVATKPPGVRVRVDGRDTGLRTPIRDPLKLTVGDHVVTFVLGTKSYDFNVSIEAGKSTRLVKSLR